MKKCFPLLHCSFLNLLLATCKKAGAAGIIIPAIALYAQEASAQGTRLNADGRNTTLEWKIATPPNENVDSLFLTVFDSGNKEVFIGKIAPAGIKNDLPLPLVAVSKSGFNADICGDGERIRLNILSDRHEDGFVRIFDSTGKEIYGAKYSINPGENNLTVDAGKLPAGIYIGNFYSASGEKSVKLVSGFDGGISGGTLRKEKLESGLKSAEAVQWKFILSHPGLLTDTFLVDYSALIKLEVALYSRATVSVKAIDVFSRKSEYGILKNVSDMTPVPDLEVMVGDINFGKTDLNGEFLFRPDLTGSVRVKVVDKTEKFYSKWYDVNLSAGTHADLKDFKAEAVFMVENYVDNLGKRLAEALWQIGTYKNLEYINFTNPSFPDSILNKKGVWVDPIYKNGQHPNSLFDINKQIKNFHVPGMPKLFETEENNAYISIHYGGTLADGLTRLTYKKNEEGLYYKSRADVYYYQDRADMDQQNIMYVVLEHELDRVYFADLEFDHKQYVMWPDAISRYVTYSYSPENSPLEDKILGLVVNGPTHLQLHNNFLLNSALNFPGYTGTKSAKMKSANINGMEKIFSRADKIETGKDKEGEFVKVTYYH